mmetsp:Transcript_28296/g.97757  ORF Transcript_28296/g.97757 Transcript_28296/m.97757 type:complete len:215 (-) Transcript_28296:551-1195(-)
MYALRTAVLKACFASSGSEMYSPRSSLSSAGQERRNFATAVGSAGVGSRPSDCAYSTQPFLSELKRAAASVIMRFSCLRFSSTRAVRSRDSCNHSVSSSSSRSAPSSSSSSPLRSIDASPAVASDVDRRRRARLPAPPEAPAPPAAVATGDSAPDAPCPGPPPVHRLAIDSRTASTPSKLRMCSDVRKRSSGTAFRHKHLHSVSKRFVHATSQS